MHSPFSTRLLLRRCSTPSYIQEPNNKSSTQWVWYWADNDGWKKYTETMVSNSRAKYPVIVLFEWLYRHFVSQLGQEGFSITKCLYLKIGESFCLIGSDRVV